MSLLEEILSSIKREPFSGDVPPNLRRIVSASVAKQRTRKRAIIMSVFALLMVGIGFGVIQFIELVPGTVLKSHDSRNVLQALESLKTQSLQGASAPPAVTITPAQSPPLPPTLPVKQSTPIHASSSTSMEDGGRATGPAENKASPPSPKGHRGTLSRNLSESAVTGPEGKTEKNMHLYTAKSYESAGDYGKALSEYKKALESDPGDFLVLNNVAGILIRLGLHKDACTYAEKALAVRKDHVPSLVNLAVARLKSGEEGEGMRCLSKALEIAPTDKAVLSNLALLHEKAGEYGKAYDLYRRLAAMDDADGHLGVARVCEKDNRSKEAEAVYRNMLKRDFDKRVKKVASERLAALGFAAEAVR